MKSKIDSRDLEILQTLQNDGRATYSSMARQLKISEAAVYTRINRLITSGYIKKFTAILDENKLNFSIGAFIGLKVSPSKYEAVLKQLALYPEILEIHDVTGDYYALLKVRTKDKESLTNLLDKIGRLDGVISTETKIILRTIKETTALPLQLLTSVRTTHAVQQKV
jgi:Lrp/AsnC family transcriptional regulator for asnA, asnC and gidA